ncbi:MAG: hypothetical protein GC190_20405 [Alphaproteobacteria bacterium]|nr:hypothetical protein [Alphaproteobacteria bacterium]
MRQTVTVVSILAMLMGTFWVAQGTGVVPLGVTAGDINWAYLGAALFALSLCTHVQVRGVSHV